MAALSAANPIAGYTVKGVQTVYGLSLWREVLFPAGTDIQVQVVRASMLKQRDSWPGWPRLPVDAPLQQLVTTAPMRTHTPNKTLSDVTTLMFIGSQKELIAAFQDAKWFEADNLNAGSAVKAVQATLRQSDYAPSAITCVSGSLQRNTTGAKSGSAQPPTISPPPTVEREQSGRIASIRTSTASATGSKPICSS
jgi:hypothetical protein